MNRLVVLVSFLDPLPWVGGHGGGERKGPTAQKPHGCHLPGFSFPPLKNMQLDRLVRPENFFFKWRFGAGGGGGEWGTVEEGFIKQYLIATSPKPAGDNKMPTYPPPIFKNP